MSIIGNPIMAGVNGPAARIFVTGLSEADTVTATKGTKTLTGKWTQKPNPAAHGLPDGYTELEYIEGAGSQWLNTNISSSDNMEIEVDFTYTALDSTEDFICGNFLEGTSGTSNRQFFFGSYQKKLDFFTPIDKHVTSLGTITIGKKYSYKFVSTNTSKTGYVDGVAVTLTNYVMGTTPIALFNGGTLQGSIAQGKMGVARIVTNGEVAGQFIPAKRNSDGAIGMYNIVNGEFYTNAGSGTFTAGPEIPQTFDGFLIKPIRDFGTWTVTATDGEQTATRDVLVDVITEYEIEIDYNKLWLYRYGDQCEEVTGGWAKNANLAHNTYSTANGTIYFGNDMMIVKSLDNYGAMVTTTNAISVDNYSKVKLIVGTIDPNLGLFVTSSNSGNISNSVGSLNATSSNNEFELNISNLTGSYYFSCGNANGRIAEVKAVWLEV